MRLTQPAPVRHLTARLNRNILFRPNNRNWWQLINPFVAASDDSSSAAPSDSATSTASQTASGAQATATESGTATTGAVTTPTNGVSNPLASSNPSSSGATEVDTGSDDDNIRIAHAVIMPLVFVILFPLAALTIYLPYNQKVRHIHAPLQVISLILMIVGLGLGVELGKQVNNVDGYHMVIGYVVVAWMVIFQPALVFSNISISEELVPAAPWVTFTDGSAVQSSYSVSSTEVWDS